MSFVSFEFILVFLPLCLVVYFVIPTIWRWAWLLSVSYFFYGFHIPAYLILLLLSTLVDYLAGLRMAASSHSALRKRWLLFSISTNLGILLFFKYFNFFTTETAQLLSWIGVHWEAPVHQYWLPLGISFYTFQTLSYSIDVYRGYIKPANTLVNSLYMSAFSHSWWQARLSAPDRYWVSFTSTILSIISGSERGFSSFYGAVLKNS